MTLAPVHHEPDPPDEFAGPASLAAALAAVQAELPGIEKSKTAKIKEGFSYSYADLAGVSREVLPLLAKHGLAWLTKPTLNGEGKFVLEYSLLHVSGDRERGEYPLQTGTPQQTGSAITYARRYCLCAVVGVAPDDDDDGAAAAAVEAHQDRQTKRNRAQAKAARQPAPQAQTGELIDPKSNLMKRLHASLRYVFASRDEGYAFMGDTIGRDITSTSELTTYEARQVIGALEALGEAPPMTGDEAEGDER